MLTSILETVHMTISTNISISFFGTSQERLALLPQDIVRRPHPTLQMHRLRLKVPSGEEKASK